MTLVDGDLEHLLRDLAPRVLSTLIRRYRDFAAAEDAAQEALLAAALQWPRDGAPDNPQAWLTQVASRRLTDQIRSDIARRRREADAALEFGYLIPTPNIESEPIQDDTLILIFMCCHPSLTPSSAIALTLRAVGGLTTAEIANAFLVPEATMAQRISRAKQTIKASQVPFSLPDTEERAQRLRSVLHILYLIFNEGYAASAGEQLQRTDLATEAIRLTRMVLRPDDEEVAGLLSLMLLTDARRIARTGPQGEPIPLNEQNRKLWDQQQITEGVALLSKTLAKGAIGPYQLQAAIAAVHDEAATTEDTDWPQILALYDLLNRIAENPMARLSQAVATAMVHGPSAGLEILQKIEAAGTLKGNHRLDAVRAHLQEMVGDTNAATANYLAAATKTANLPERNYLLAKAARLRAKT
jgi:RNA polymerase sigma factor (sigma-70 family)